MKQTKFIFLLIISFLMFFSCENKQEENNDTTPIVVKPYGEIFSKEATKINSYFQSRHKKNLFSGSILFAENGRIIYNKAFGYANIVKKTKLNTCSAFQLASVTKPITAIAILKLKEQGKLSYDDDVRIFFPEFPYEGITVKHLLTHRSGLPNYMYFADEYWTDKEIPIKNQDVINLMIKNKPATYYKPNKRYNYSNTGYCLLAAIIEHVSGETFETFVKEEIFNPVGMNDSFIYRKGNGDLELCIVKGYNKNNTLADNTYQNGVVGDKGIYSTVEDLFRLDQALYDGTLLSKETLEEAFTPLHKDLKADDNYGLGWRIRDYKNGDKIVYHSGWWKGFRTYFIRDLKSKKTVIVLNNSNRGSFLKVDELLGLF